MPQVCSLTFLPSLPPCFLFSKSFSRNTYGPPRKCCKKKTYGHAKPFRCNTYTKHGMGVNNPILPASTLPGLRLDGSLYFFLWPVRDSQTATKGIEELLHETC